MDKNDKSIRKLYSTTNEKLTITVAKESTEDEWMGTLKALFPGIPFEVRVPSGDRFFKPKCKLGVDDLLKIKRERRLHAIRLYVKAVGKGKNVYVSSIKRLRYKFILMVPKS